MNGKEKGQIENYLEKKSAEAGEVKEKEAVVRMPHPRISSFTDGVDGGATKSDQETWTDGTVGSGARLGWIRLGK